MNLLLLLGEAILAFGGVLAAYKVFGKKGLMMWVPVASILANLVTAKTADFIGFGSALGTVLFASNFLATDILCEQYEKKSATKAVLMGLFANVMFIVATQVALLYVPSEFDYAHESMSTLFALNLRISVASIVMYAVANIADVMLYSKLKKRMNGRHMWIRNNVSTILCNCGENFAFIFLAFIGIYTAKECLEIAIVASVIEGVVAMIDTPFLYMARRIKGGDLNAEDGQTKEGV